MFWVQGSHLYLRKFSCLSFEFHLKSCLILCVLHIIHFGQRQLSSFRNSKLCEKFLVYISPYYLKKKKLALPVGYIGERNSEKGFLHFWYLVQTLELDVYHLEIIKSKESPWLCATDPQIWTMPSLAVLGFDMTAARCSRLTGF